MKKYLIILILSALFGCGDSWEDPDKHVWIDLDQTNQDLPLVVEEDSSSYVRVAVSSMTSPQETFSKYNQMLVYIETKLGKKIKLIQRKTYKEINELLKQDKIDMAFICSGAYVVGEADSAFTILAIPERDKQRYYRAYIIVNKDSGLNTFADLEDKKFVFSDSLSNTGMYYPMKRLKQTLNKPADYFSNTYFSNAHDYSIELVSRNIVDGASVNSLIFDYIKKFNPEKVMNVKIIERSETFGMPPIVVSKNIDPELKAGLNNIVLQMHEDAKGKEILDGLLIDRFVNESDSLYNSIREMCRVIGCSGNLSKNETR